MLYHVMLWCFGGKLSFDGKAPVGWASVGRLDGQVLAGWASVVAAAIKSYVAGKCYLGARRGWQMYLPVSLTKPVRPGCGK